MTQDHPHPPEHPVAPEHDKRPANAARSRWEAATMWPLITASALFLVIYSWVSLDTTLPAGLNAAFATILGLVWLSFLVDFVVRWLLSSDKRYFVRHNLIDLGSVLFPLVRPFRLLRYLREIPPLRGNSGTSVRTRVAINAIAFVVMFIYVISLAELVAERNAPHATIVSFGDSIWWACVTMATVGYGDFVPVTIPGRILAVMLMIGGIAIVGTASATIVSYLGEVITHRNPDSHRSSTERASRDPEESEDL
jgi:voltage-gated potassium channel